MIIACVDLTASACWYTYAQAGQRWYMQEYDPQSKSHAPDAPRSGTSGCFLELQTGVARTQSQYFPMGAGATLEWTGECMHDGFFDCMDDCMTDSLIAWLIQ